MDSKIHPPVGTGQRAPNRGPGRPSGPGPNKNRLPSSLSVIRNSPGSGRPQNSLSNLMNLDKNKINLKGKTVEKLGLIGKEKAIACEVLISIKKYD